ncbi:hypothetical protein [Mycolicibacterium peregrinum]|uniref:hypothetical protein n=1 Tax=Mycolicibacterium peregrinum TaxID=43304 RepID=UPI0013DED723|nr:hypothetical protein [Mycolicibacterium peregrinum]
MRWATVVFGVPAATVGDEVGDGGVRCAGSDRGGGVGRPHPDGDPRDRHGVVADVRLHRAGQSEPACDAGIGGGGDQGLDGAEFGGGLLRAVGDGKRRAVPTGIGARIGVGLLEERSH